MNVIPFFLNPLTPEKYDFSNKMLHNVDVALKKRPETRVTLSASSYAEYQAAVVEIAALKAPVAEAPAAVPPKSPKSGK